MAVKPIPEGYNRVSPYLIVKGAAELIDFLKQVFDAEELVRTTHSNGSIMHAEVKIGDSVVMIGGAQGGIEPMPASVHVYTEDTDAVYKKAIDAGAVSIMEPEDQFYGARSAGVKDPSGNVWWLATNIEDLSEEELAKRSQAFRK